VLRRGRRPAGREQVRTVPDELGLPLIVKPPREGSSIGVTKVAWAIRRCRRAVQAFRPLDADVLCEQFIEGDEVTCPCMGTGAERHVRCR
jgi:D-alanine-D-alanine ligase